MVVIRVEHFELKPTVNRGVRNGRSGRPKKTEKEKKKRVHLTLSQEIAQYLIDYRKRDGRNLSGSRQADYLIRLGLCLQGLLPLLLADRSEDEIQFILSQIPMAPDMRFILEM